MRCALLLTVTILMASITAAPAADNLGVTYDQSMTDMDRFFPTMTWEFLPEPSWYGRSSFDGRNDNGLDVYASFPIYPLSEENKTDIGSVVLYAPLHKDWPEAKTAKSMLLQLLCLRNAVTEWSHDNERDKWLTSSGNS